MNSVRLYFSFFLCLIVNLTFAKAQDSLITKIELHISNGQVDSALRLLLETEASNTRVSKNLVKVFSTNKARPLDFYTVGGIFLSNKKVNYLVADSFVQRYVQMPSVGSISLEYIKLKNLQLNRLRNHEAFGKAQERYDEVIAYINSFEQNKEAEIALAYVKTHDVILSYINKDYDRSMRFAKEIYEIGVLHKDTNLITAGLTHQCDVFVANKDLDKFIETSRRCFEIERNRPSKSQNYSTNLSQLINGLTFQGGNGDEVLELLFLLYNYPGSKLESYSFFAEYLASSDLTPQNKDKVFTSFEVQSIEEFAEKTWAEASQFINPNEQYYLLLDLARALEANNSFTMAMKFMHKAVEVNSQTYSEQLSESIANFKTREIEKEKNLAIQVEKNKSEKAFLISVFIGVFSSLILIALAITIRQRKALSKKNHEIEKQRAEIEKRDAEKGLLLKEIHHRVKNNFQIVSSLLEMQSKGIEDEKAKELAIEGKNRVKSMAIIHQRLYQNEELTIDFNNYIKTLTNEITNMYDPNNEVNVSINAENHHLDIDTAIPLGLILNELITNAFKYGFSDLEKKLEVELKKINEEEFVLRVADNGKGVPESFDPLKAKSLGLRLIRRLSKQLQGSMNYSFNNGSVFEVSFLSSTGRGELD